MKLSLYGVGSVGRELIRQTIGNQTYVSIADSSGVIVKPQGFSRTELAEIVCLKRDGGRITDYESSGVRHQKTMIETFFSTRPDALVDTSTTQSYQLLASALNRGINVIGSNKAPYADVSYSDYKSLFMLARKKKKTIDNRTTVSANLGVLERVHEFSKTAGGVDFVRSSPSGTMAYISHRINGEKGLPFSKALRRAKEKLYTESDPRIDISGRDSVRKLVTIGRTADVPIEISDIRVEEILTGDMKCLPVSRFMEKVKDLDADFRRRVRNAKEKDLALRYVAEMDFNKKRYEVGFKEISKSDKIAMSSGTDSVVSIYPRSWNGKAMTLEGPGAGIDVTTQGLIAGLYDIENRL